MYHAFYPGRPWLDTEGKRIQAHGGSVLYHDGVYYWYGENKEHTDGKSGIWHWGVRCYSSKDLYNWEDRGLIIPPDVETPSRFARRQATPSIERNATRLDGAFDHPGASLHPASMMDRPHILYNERTRKFVCWLKIMHPDGRQTLTVLTADDILGPYTMVREGLRPLGMNAGDFDLAKAPDGKAYYYFERVHSELICADLTDDYTDVTGYYSTHFPRVSPPYVREAPAHFYRKGKHYLITSGTTGYLPNPSEIAVADTWHGPFTVLGNPHPQDESQTSYHSQISCVFRVETPPRQSSAAERAANEKNALRLGGAVETKKDLYIAMADRWIPDHMEYDYEEYGREFARAFGSEAGSYTMNPKFGADSERNTSIADYVWLPLQFEDEKDAPSIEKKASHLDGAMGTLMWRDSWTLEEFM